MSQQEKKELGFFKSIILFVKSKRFRVHFIISLAFAFIILWLSFKSLNIYTHHGETITVPDFSNVKIEELDNFVSDKSLRYEIIDSVYDAKIPGGVVIKQDPENNSSVKQNRTVYLTVSATMAPLVKMPNLVDASIRQALAMIESYGLKAGQKDFRPDPCVNCVLAQMIKGEKVEAGAMIPQGSVIDLVLGRGQDGEQLNVPCVIGLTHREASDKIAENGMSEGSVTCGDCKTSKEKETAKVVRQTPGCSSDNLVNPGTVIDLFMSVKKIIVPADTTDEDEFDSKDK